MIDFANRGNGMFLINLYSLNDAIDGVGEVFCFMVTKWVNRSLFTNGQTLTHFNIISLNISCMKSSFSAALFASN